MGYSIAVLVLIAPSNRVLDLLPLVPEILKALVTIKPGEVREVGGTADKV